VPAAVYHPTALAAIGGRQLAPGVHRLESEAGGRALYQFLLCGERTVLIDAGFATTPGATIGPYLSGIGMDFADLDLVICTHADPDHYGGSRSLLERNPALLVSCGLADRELISDTELLIASRYEMYRHPHGVGYDDAMLRSIRELGPGAPVDVAWCGGEILRIGPGWDVRVIASPGHSLGHVVVHDLRHDWLYTGDAVHGAFYPDLAGRPAMPPNYVDVDAYLATVATLEDVGAAALHGSHWPTQEGREAVRAFLGDAREEVARTRSAVLAALAVADPLGLGEIIERCTADLGGWRDDELMYSVDAHLRRLERSGDVVCERIGRHETFRLGSGPRRDEGS
jgi:glyoxylase-like metal-dependent hydrolase (beta-lactamase superfamily II)